MNRFQSELQGKYMKLATKKISISFNTIGRFLVTLTKVVQACEKIGLI